MVVTVPPPAAPAADAAPVARHRVSRGDILVTVGIVAGAIGAGNAIAALLLLVAGYPPLESLVELYRGGFGSQVALGDSLNRATPLLLVAAGFIVAYRAGLVSIGAEGQIYIGAAAAGAVALGLGASAGVAALPVALGAAAVGGAAWSGISGIMRARRGINEVITTFLMNFVAIALVAYLLSQPNLLQKPGSQLAQSEELPAGAWLPRLLPGTEARVHVGFILAVLLAIAVTVCFRYTTLGFRLRMLGHGPGTADHIGVPVRRLIVWSMVISGAFGGLAGSVLVLGEQHRVQQGLSPGYGFTGVVVALMARSSGIGAIPAAILLGGLIVGGKSMQASAGVPSSLVLVIQGVIVLALAASEYFVRRRRQR